MNKENKVVYLLEHLKEKESFLNSDTSFSIQALNKALMVDPLNWDLRICLAEAYYDNARFHDALNEVNKIIKKFPFDLETLNLKGIILFNLKDISLSIKTFKACKEIDHFFLRAYLNLGIIYLHQGNYDFALLEFKKAYKINIEHEDVLYNLGYTYALIGKYSEAESIIKQSIKLGKKVEECNKLLGYILLKNNKPAKALKHFIKVNKYRDSEILTGIGISHYHLNDFEKASFYFKEALRLNTLEALAYYFLAQINYKFKEVSSAICNVKSALAIDHELIEARILLGDLYKERGSKEKAKIVWLEILKREPYNQEVCQRIKLLEKE